MPPKGTHQTEKTKRKMRDSKMGKKNPMFGKIPWNKNKKGLQVAWNKGQHSSKEAIEKSRESHKGIYPNEETRKKQKEAAKGHKGYWRGKTHSKETKLKLSKMNSGENTHLWKGGISFEPYCPKFNNDLKERVREFFNRKCYVCGKTEGEDGRKLSIHHVNYDKMVCCNDTPPLFVPLCKKHHLMTNIYRENWQEFFEVSLEYLTQGKCFYTEEEMIKCP